MMHLIPSVALAAEESPTSGVPVWLQIVGAVVAVVVGISTVLGAVLTARKSRLEMRKLEKELSEDSPQKTPTRGIVASEASSMAVRAQSYLVRFIILSLAYIFWGLFTSIASTIVSGSISGLAIAGQGSVNFAIYANILSFLPQIVDLTVRIAIFLSIGWPLLKDILQDMGLRPRVFWFRDVPNAFRNVNQQSRDIEQAARNVTDASSQHDESPVGPPLGSVDRH